jgi:outer membrane protein assembly factor BamB
VVVGLVVMGYGCDNQQAATLQAWNLATGAPLWSLPTGWAPQRGDLAGSAGSHLYATDPSGTVVDLNPKSGQVEYSLSQAVNVLAVDTSRVYATCGSQGQSLCAYNTSTAALEWQKTNLSASPTSAAEADGVLYLGTGAVLNAATGQRITKIGESPVAVGDGRIVAVPDPRVIDLFGLPGS